MSEINVLFCADNRYSFLAGVTIASLLESNPQHRFRLVVCSSEPRDGSKDAELERFVRASPNATLELIEFNLEHVRHLLPLSKYFTPATYLRLFLTEFLPAEISRILYLDSDTIVRGDLESLWETDVSDYYAAAVPEPFQASHPGFKPGETYFNSGVMLINAARWREEGVLPRLLAFIRENFENLTAHDQDVMNNVFRGGIRPLPLKWNFQPSFADFSAHEIGLEKEEFHRLRRQPAIIHYAGRFKPWLYMEEPHYKHLYRGVLRRTPWADRLTTDLTLPNRLLKARRLSRAKRAANWYFPGTCRLLRRALGRRSRVNVDASIG